MPAFRTLETFLLFRYPERINLYIPSDETSVQS